MAAADETARFLRRSTSSRNSDAAITIVGSATSTASHGRTSFIAILAFVRARRHPHRHHRVAQPSVERCKSACEPYEGRDDRLIQQAVEKSAFERDEEEPPPNAVRPERAEILHRCWRPFADRVRNPMQVVE